MSKPIVIHLIDGLSIGGGGTHIYRLVTHLRQGRYEPLVCCLLGGPLKADIEDQGVQVITLNISRRSIILFPLFLIDVFRVIVGLILLMHRRKADIIHAHLPDCAVLGGIAGKLSGAGVVATYHGLKILPYDRKKCDPRNYLRMISHRFAGKFAHRSIAVSEEVKALMVRVMRVEPHKIIVINNGVDIGEYEKPVDLGSAFAELDLVFEDKVITFVGRLVSSKGHKFLIMAAQEVIRLYPNAKFLLVGDGPERDKLTHLVSRLCLTKNVKFLGERSDIPNILAITDVFVFPSLTEGFGIVAIEAMAAGIPVVASRIAPLTEIVKDGDTGFLVQPASPPAFAQAICHLLADPCLARRMGAMGKVRVKNYFNFQKTLHKTEQVYDEVMINKRSSRGETAKR